MTIKTRFTKLIATILIMLCVFSCVMINTTAATSTTVYFYNGDNWSDVYAYEWSTQLESNVLGQWPGTPATSVGDGWYSVNVPLVANGNDACFNVIFNNNGGDNNKQYEATIIDSVNVYMKNQSDATYSSKEAALGQNVTPPADGETIVYFYNGDNWSEVYAYEWSTQLESNVLGEWPGKKATSAGEGWYYVSVPLVANGNDACFNIIFNNNGGDSNKQYEATIIDNENVYMKNENDSTYSSKEEALSGAVVPTPSQGETVVHFYNSEGWASVYAYQWNEDGDTDILGEWPGKKTTSEGNGWYYVIVPLSTEKGFNIIFNDGIGVNQAGNNYIDTEEGIYLTTAENIVYKSKELAEAAVNSGTEVYPEGSFKGYGVNQGYIQYQAEEALTNAKLLSPTTLYGNADCIQTEAIGRQAVKLANTGDFVEFTLDEAANAFVLRACIPDSSNGQGLNKTLSVYIDGKHSQDITVSSEYSWIYGAYPYTNNPSDGSPHKFFSDTRVLLNAGTVSAGTTIRLQKDSTDSSDYYIIDMIECEEVAKASSMPAGYLSITDFGATANDGKDDYNALTSCIIAAKAQNKSVWIPAGEFNLNNNKDSVEVSGVTIRGAGMWHSVLKGYGARFMMAGNNCKFYDFSVIGTQNRRINDAMTSAFDGSCPSGGIIENIWIEHSKCGIWLTNTNGMKITGCRIRNVFADGINLCSGTTNTTIENCSLRNTGDDSIAIWSASPACSNNKIINNTVEAPQMASGIAVYGGTNNTVSYNVIKDIIAYGGGINISTNHSPTDFSGTLNITDNILYRADSYSWDKYYHMGAIWIWSLGNGINSAVNIERNYIYGTNSTAVTIEGEGHISQVTFKDMSIYSARQYGFEAHNGTYGSVTLDNVAVSDAQLGITKDSSDRFEFVQVNKGVYEGKLPEPDTDTPVEPENPDPGTTESTRVYFYNSEGWNTVYAYQWNEEGVTNSLGSWPGKTATSEGNNWYYVDVPIKAEDGFSIIFNNGDELKSENYINDESYVYLTTENDKTYKSKADAISAITNEESFLLGDVDLDLKLTVKDATAIQKHTAELIILNDEQLKRADVDKDSRYTVKDATEIQKIVAGLK